MTRWGQVDPSCRRCRDGKPDLTRKRYRGIEDTA